MTGRTPRLVVAAALLTGWLGWLGYTALVKYRGPVVSRAQTAGATLVVFAHVPAADGPQTVAVTHVLTGPKPDGPVVVTNLADADGFTGADEYLLPLVKGRGDSYLVAGPLRSPGYEAAGVPTVYRATPAVRAQAAALFP